MSPGGLEDDQTTMTEIFSEGAFSPGPLLPEPLSSHCLMRLDETHIALTGGWGENSSAIRLSYLFDMETEEWNRFDRETNYEHFRHGCGVVDVGDGIPLPLAKHFLV